MLDVVKIRSVIFAAVAAAACAAATAGAAEESCLDHPQLLELPFPVTHRIQPCDQVGALYLAGLDAITSNVDFPDRGSPTYEITNDLGYYFFARTYLSTLILSEEDGSLESRAGEMISQLVPLLATIPEGIQEAAGGPSRSNYYRTFALGEYLKAVKRAFNDSDQEGRFRYPNQTLWAEPVLEATRSLMQHEMSGGLFGTYKELVCFVQNDIPTLEISTITGSEKFLNCVAIALEGE